MWSLAYLVVLHLAVVWLGELEEMCNLLYLVVLHLAVV
jgi:hypothetical protein